MTTVETNYEIRDIITPASQFYSLVGELASAKPLYDHLTITTEDGTSIEADYTDPVFGEYSVVAKWTGKSYSVVGYPILVHREI